MKYLWIPLLFCLSLVASASENTDAFSSHQQDAAENQVKTRQGQEHETTVADSAVSDKAQQRDEFILKVKEELVKLDQEIADLRDKTQKTVHKKKAELKPLLHDIEEKRSAVERRVTELNDAGIEKWDELKIRVTEAIGQLKQTIRKHRPSFPK